MNLGFTAFGVGVWGQEREKSCIVVFWKDIIPWEHAIGELLTAGHETDLSMK